MLVNTRKTGAPGGPYLLRTAQYIKNKTEILSRWHFGMQQTRKKISICNTKNIPQSYGWRIAKDQRADQPTSFRILVRTRSNTSTRISTIMIYSRILLSRW